MPRGKWPGLNERWKVGARHGAYHRDGHWYDHLKAFPGALFDAHGYIRFETKEDYEGNSWLRHTEHLNIPGGISSIPGYVKVE